MASVRYESEQGKLWTMIEDTGVGISPKQKHHLFIAFRNQNCSQSSLNAGRKAYTGIGRGLSNAKSLVNALSGEINILSKPNCGTIVTFSVDIVVKKERSPIAKNTLLNDVFGSAIEEKKKTTKLLDKENTGIRPSDLVSVLNDPMKLKLEYMRKSKSIDSISKNQEQLKEGEQQKSHSASGFI